VGSLARAAHLLNDICWLDMCARYTDALNEFMTGGEFG
jgi:hypothetical protein